MDSSGKKQRHLKSAGRRRVQHGKRHSGDQPFDAYESLQEDLWLSDDDIAMLRRREAIPSRHMAFTKALLAAEPDRRPLYDTLQNLPPKGHADLILWEFEALRKAEATSLETMLYVLLDSPTSDWASSIYGVLVEDKLVDLLVLYWRWFEGLNEQGAIARIASPEFATARAKARQRMDGERDALFS